MAGTWSRNRRLAGTVLGTLGVLLPSSTGVATPDPAAFTADAPHTIVELQPWRTSDSIHVRGVTGVDAALTLVNLNPRINAWYLFTVTTAGSAPRVYHLENPKPLGRGLLLDAHFPDGVIVKDDDQRVSCDLLGGAQGGSLEQGRRARAIYYPLCEGRVYLRSAGSGHRTGLEAATEFLRDRVWGGEAVIGVGHQLLSDANKESGVVKVEATDGPSPAEGPAPARVDASLSNRAIAASGLGIGVRGTTDGSLAPGRWYPTGTAGSYVSVFRPDFIDPALLADRRARPLDGVESTALCYLIAFDLARVRVAYARGTTHPEVHWSEHMPSAMRNPQLPGPDGISDVTPLVGTGLVPPFERLRTLATFTAGFKREHGAFLYGDLSRVNASSHYGFIEQGVVFSRLQPGLATLIVLDDGSVEVKTWEQRDEAELPRVRFARQNGVPIVEVDPATGAIVPGRLVTEWGPGNWSGTQDRKLRAMRSAVALQTVGSKRYLIYAVFSSATPSAMARVFQAYGCQYALLLDMNALEHTYCAFYRASGGQRSVEYLMKGMQEVDHNMSTGGRNVLRFIDYADNRDFFYVLPREDAGTQGSARGTP